MMHSTRHRTLVALALAATVFVAGCGDRKGMIPKADAQTILSQLDQLDQQMSSGDCDNIASTVSDLQEQVSQLPTSVDSRLRARIEEGLANLSTQAPRDCLDQSLTTTETTTTQTTATTTTTVPTTPTQTTPVPTTPTQTVPPPTPTQTTPAPTPTQTTPSGGGGTPSPDPDTGGATPDTGGDQAP